MAKYVQKGTTIDYVNSGDSTILAGTVISLTNRVGVAADDIPAGAVGALVVMGIFEAEKDSSNISLGDLLYYDTSNKKFTKTTGSNIPAGWAIKAAGTSATTVLVCISGEHPAPEPVTPAAVVAAVSATNGNAAAGDAPTKAEFDAVVTLANANKTAINAVIAALQAASLMANS